MIRVVLDTNILVSANLSDEGLEAWVVSLALNQKIQLHVSEPILQEYERVLRYPRLKFDAKQTTRFLARSSLGLLEKV
jgi:putative PIN family toxin of toxin-antitoxin system